MDHVTVDIREFRENLAVYLLARAVPVAITSHGDTIGYFIPARRKRTETQRAALSQAVLQLNPLLAAKGIDEDEIAADFKRWRAGKRR